ncbi:peptidoglycan/xylan/chitin deacetylase (PgdA/CDA1 family) [Sinomonas atrocyanea]|uniref:polysaccharide deacetylase family protein n=1 Tax=Sinomonas atrocyanea TaxID=37927 RepID=UPI00278171A3|nr:polysaccharide deacetylase family protein [Sinomonas atrocyanea]MDP9883153.1 peptidoglycan/xylan/chitin deacetylase (PgdA/CDA1 family) [Sinomonas atrocyanea]
MGTTARDLPGQARGVMMRRFPAVLAMIALLVLTGWTAAGGPRPAMVPALNAIDLHYEQLGGAASFLGAPLAAEYPVAGGAARDYQGGSIYWSAATGAWEVHGGIRTEYLGRGGPGGFLGFPRTDETTTPGAAGRYNDFAGGSVYWSAATGAHEVHGGIRAEYLGRGGPAGFLGFPVRDESPTQAPTGRYSDFTGGSVYWSPATGAHEVHGAIRARYVGLGGTASILGFPVTDEAGAPDGIGRYNHFSGANGSSIYWDPLWGPHEVLGGIRSRWSSLGWEHGRLGYPISGEYSITGGRRSDFQHGAILWNSTTSTTQVVYAALPSALMGVDLERIPTSRRVVALTFDAGANNAAVRSILNTLAANGVPATFFLTGAWANLFRSDVSAIVAAGHTVGNHSMTHPYFTALTDAQIAAEVGNAQSAIVGAGADPRPFFRFPYGDRNARTIADVNAAGYAAIRWTVDTLGWEGTVGGTRGPDFVLQRVMAAAQPGEIVLMHLGSNPDDGSTLDAAALPAVIAQLRAAGYGFVTLDAALG